MLKNCLKRWSYKQDDVECPKYCSEKVAFVHSKFTCAINAYGSDTGNITRRLKPNRKILEDYLWKCQNNS